MSVGLGLAIGLSYSALAALGLFGGTSTTLANMVTILLTIAVFLDMLVFAFVTACCQAAIQDTAEGHLLPQEDTMSEIAQWLLIAPAWLMLGAIAAVIGMPLSLVFGEIAYPLAIWLVFPILLLGILETESVLMPISIPVIRSLVYQWSDWLIVYLFGALLAGAVLVVCDGFFQAPIALFLMIGPMLASVALIYARLLGRLAWKASGSPMAHVEVDGPSEDDLLVIVDADDAVSYDREKRPRITFSDRWNENDRGRPDC